MTSSILYVHAIVQHPTILIRCLLFLTERILLNNIKEIDEHIITDHKNDHYNR